MAAAAVLIFLHPAARGPVHEMGEVRDCEVFLTASGERMRHLGGQASSTPTCCATEGSFMNLP